MNTNKAEKIECEKKLLIAFPDTDLLKSQGGCTVTEMEQTYLLSGNGSMRVRKATRNGETKYIRNIKKRISDMSSYEDEKEISEEAYNELLLCADPERSTVRKTRYAFPYGKHIIEIDVYPFWSDRAVLEIELDAEDEEYEIPSCITVLKDVTNDKRYSNRALAREIITEEV